MSKLPLTLDPSKFPCPCVKEHHPQPLRNQNHHVLPQYAGGQTTDSSAPGYTPMQPLCPTAHDNVHATLEEWAKEAGGNPNFAPPRVTRNNHVVYRVALQGWNLFKQYWPDKPFPREYGSSPSTG